LPTERREGFSLVAESSLTTDATARNQPCYVFKLPFGEAIQAGVGGRSAAQGYVAESVRQGFTLYERDDETGLDYAQARYYANCQGRFTTPDPLLSSGDVASPQSWNRYAYAFNSPLVNTDPFGLYVFDKKVTTNERDKFRKSLVKLEDRLKKIGAKYGTTSDQYKKAERSLSVYGKEGVKNGVTIQSGNLKTAGKTQAAGAIGQKTADNPTGQDIRITFDKSSFDNEETVAHEGSHAADGSDWIASGFSANKNPTIYQTELDAYTVSSLIIEAGGGGGVNVLPGNPNTKPPILPAVFRLWNQSWKAADVEKLRVSNIDKILSHPKNLGGYGVNQQNQGGPAFIKGSKF
jgi:RHS repeat-associated protein